ncbi:MAG: protein disulfide oxidoreductase [Gammaproteobacteria bacterium]|nr:MAG: protein disulfide oxidoreductase [Gammaproteobacteria bacterium]
MHVNLLEFIKRRRWLKITLEIMVILLVFMALRAWQTRDAVEGEAPVILDRLLTGELVDTRQLNDKPLLVYFWAEWCPICKMVNGKIDAIARDYQVISIASWPESDEDVRKYIQESDIKMPVILDNHGQWASAYGVRGVPAIFIIDKQGIIRFMESGFSTETGLRLRLWWLEK